MRQIFGCCFVDYFSFLFS
uniref:Uncharacterized protein n=1 Tax=Rhizophora mucronata TaxID=61149 RepID=A0A2P2P321_RHIMU